MYSLKNDFKKKICFLFVGLGLPTLVALASSGDETLPLPPSRIAISLSNQSPPSSPDSSSSSSAQPLVKIDEEGRPYYCGSRCASGAKQFFSMSFQRNPEGFIFRPKVRVQSE